MVHTPLHRWVNVLTCPTFNPPLHKDILYINIIHIYSLSPDNSVAHGDTGLFNSHLLWSWSMSSTSLLHHVQSLDNSSTRLAVKTSHPPASLQAPSAAPFRQQCGGGSAGSCLLRDGGAEVGWSARVGPSVGVVLWGTYIYIYY